ncbi:hypothetical protein QQ73_11960 [Candidatus Endoriftia persephone str. Guaymas]|nr:hypothetical protein [Candidatus Endoriftia persephone str. Guaymas]
MSLIIPPEQNDGIVAEVYNEIQQMHDVSQEQIETMKQGPAQAPLDAKEPTLLQCVLKAVGDSNSIAAEDIKQLKTACCSEWEIFDALAHGSRQVSQRHHVECVLGGGGSALALSACGTNQSTRDLRAASGTSYRRRWPTSCHNTS